MSKSGQGGGQLSADQINAAMAQLQGMPSDRPGYGAPPQQPQASSQQQFGQMMAQRPAYVPPMMTTDPNLAANMEGLNGLLSASKEKKMAALKIFTGGG